MIRFIVIFAFIFLCVSCANKSKTDLAGKYKGSDGSKTNPQDAQITVAVTGDGFISGSWSSAGDIKEGQFAGKSGFFKGRMTLKVVSGSCEGQFKGTFEFKDNAFSGLLGENPRCPERSYAFSLQKL